MKISVFRPLLAGLLPVLLMIASCTPDETNDIQQINASVIAFTETDNTTTVSVPLTLVGTVVAPVEVTYRWEEGQAKKGSDFEAEGGTFTFSPDEMEKTLELQLIGDNNLELTETFDLFLTVDGRDFVVQLSIQDNDPIEAILSDADGFYTPETYESMTLAFSDEFNDASLDESTWTYEIGDGCDKGLCGWGNNELQNYTNESENIRMEDGKLIITALKDQLNNYTSARIITEDKIELQYGRIDIRAKMPKGQGLWPALWMLGANISEVSWPECGEIDIMELVGHEPEATHGTVHYDNNGYTTSTGVSTLSSGDLSDQFHVYSIIWERDVIKWYLDNELFKTFTRASGDGGYPFNAPFYFIMNVAVGGNWPGYPDDTTVFPQTMEVDYLRVFQ
ncbi:MAG: family 16 glycosylhydrolase [Bacteroidota bacterium]